MSRVWQGSQERQISEGQKVFRTGIIKACRAAKVHLRRCQLKGGQKIPTGTGEVAVVLFAVGWVREPLLGINRICLGTGVVGLGTSTSAFVRIRVVAWFKKRGEQQLTASLSYQLTSVPRLSSFCWCHAVPYQHSASVADLLCTFGQLVGKKPVTSVLSEFELGDCRDPVSPFHTSCLSLEFDALQVA